MLLPTDPGYPQAARTHLGQFDHIRPSAIANCASPDDVGAALRFARDTGAPVAIRSGGHSYGGYSTTTGLLIDLSRFHQVQVDDRAITVGTGARYRDILRTLRGQGVTVSTGLCPTVCPGGFLQGGGVGWTIRSFGPACDQVTAVHIVLSDGELVRCDERREPDLFWALRGGGGGNFGVVLAFEIEPLTIARMTTYRLSWPWDRAVEVATVWQAWATHADARLGAELGFSLVNGAAQPEVTVFGTWLGDPQALTPALAELQAAVGTPSAGPETQTSGYGDAMLDWYRRHDAAALSRDGFSIERGRLTDAPVPRPGVEDLLAVLVDNRVPGQPRHLRLFALGGRANDRTRTDTAYVHRTAQFAVSFSSGLSPVRTPDDETAVTTWVDQAFEVLDRHSNGECLQNFVDPRLPDWRRAYYAENGTRLAAVKAAYDPDRLFDFPQAI